MLFPVFQNTIVISTQMTPIAGKGEGVHFQDFTFAEKAGENFQ